MLIEAMMERYVLCPNQLASAGMLRGHFAFEDNSGKAKAKAQAAASGWC
jgi:hypothetical protein